MSVYESDQLIGVELELYCEGGEDGLLNYVEGNGMDGFRVCGDGSLSAGGAEIKFDQGVKLSEAGHRLDDLHLLAKGETTIDTYFGIEDSEQPDRRIKYLGKGDVAELNDARCETGLHIHFGMPSEFRGLDIIRLIRSTAKDIINIREKAWRINDQWGGSPAKQLIQLHNGIGRALSQVRSPRVLIDGRKYQGLNLGNITSTSLNTIEFRFAHGALMADRDGFNDYLTLLKSHWDNAFTFENTMDWGEYTFREDDRSSYSTRQINVFDRETNERLGDFTLVL